MTKSAKPIALSLFSGAGGMDLGVTQAGFRVLACVESDPHCCETLRAWTKRTRKKTEIGDPPVLVTSAASAGNDDEETATVELGLVQKMWTSISRLPREWSNTRVILTVSPGSTFTKYQSSPGPSAGPLKSKSAVTPT